MRYTTGSKRTEFLLSIGVTDFVQKNTGYSIADIYEDPEKSYLAQAYTADQYNSDGEPFYTFVSYGSWEFGGEINWPVDRYASGPSVAKTARSHCGGS